MKDPWKSGPVGVDRAALLAELPAAETVSLRLTRGVAVSVNQAGIGRPARETPTELVFRQGKKETARVLADEARLDLLEEIVGSRQPADLGSVVLPKDLPAFEALVEERAALVAALLQEGRELVERAERLVCALYRVPDELTEEVVAHAIRRADAST